MSKFITLINMINYNIYMHWTNFVPLIVFLAFLWMLHKIQVVHISTLPSEKQQEIRDRNKIKAAVNTRYVRCADGQPCKKLKIQSHDPLL